jgi:fructose-specific component phosphotransferase system IIB-like protein
LSNFVHRAFYNPTNYNRSIQNHAEGVEYLYLSGKSYNASKCSGKYWIVDLPRRYIVDPELSSANIVAEDTSYAAPTTVAFEI